MPPERNPRGNSNGRDIHRAGARGELLWPSQKKGEPLSRWKRDNDILRSGVADISHLHRHIPHLPLTNPSTQHVRRNAGPKGCYLRSTDARLFWHLFLGGACLTGEQQDKNNRNPSIASHTVLSNKLRKSCVESRLLRSQPDLPHSPETATHGAASTLPPYPEAAHGCPALRSGPCSSQR